MCLPKDRHQFTRPVLKGREITKERLEVRGSVQSERSSTLLGPLLNPEPDFRFGSCPMLNFGLDFGPVHRSSGPNRGSGPDCGITTPAESSRCLTINSSKLWRIDSPSKTTVSPITVVIRVTCQDSLIFEHVSSLPCRHIIRRQA